MSGFELVKPDRNLRELLDLVAACHAFQGVSVAAAAREKALAELVGNETLGQVWLLRKDGAVIGYAAICYGFSIEFGGRDAFLDELFIAEPWRGRGLGAEALATLKRWLVDAGLVALHLEVDRDNARAKAAYVRARFEDRERYHLMSCRLAGSPADTGPDG